MTSEADRAYTFVYRGQLTDEALDRAGRQVFRRSDVDHEQIAEMLSVDALDEGHVENARAMATVYTAVAAFENSVREMISKTLMENVGENWWVECVSDKIRKQAKTRLDDEAKVRWHGQRGDDPIQFTMLPNLMNIIRNNQEHFAPFIHDFEWAAGIFDVIDRSRNVIMHSGTLHSRDIIRLGMYIRDWTSQVAT